MRVKIQKLARNLQSNLTFRAFSLCEAYREESVKSAPHLRERRFLVAIFPPSIHSILTSVRRMSQILQNICIIHKIILHFTKFSGRVPNGFILDATLASKYHKQCIYTCP